MLSGRHKRKLIDGLVIAMGKPSSGRSEPAAEDEGDGDSDEDMPDEGTPSEEKGDDREMLSCARDAARAIGVDDLDDAQARAFGEAIKKIVGGY